MAEYLTRRWIAEQESGLPRSERRACEYRPYLPDPLMERTFRLAGEDAADVADAENAIARLDARASALTDTEALARILLRAESVASSRIEGLAVGPRRLVRAEAARQMGVSPGDVTAEEVLGNIDAMRAALELAEASEPLTVSSLLEVHRRLLAGTTLHAHAGVLRDRQNWIGGNRYNPCGAAFVPPPPEHVEPLLADLCDFCNSDMLPAVVQAAIAHAQFETIHPFADGNGRVGRALVHFVLRRRGLSTRVQPPVSLILATRAQDYVWGLTLMRYEGSPDCVDAETGASTWVSIFAAACSRAVEDAVAFEDRCAALEQGWRERLGRVRAGSAVDLLLRSLPGTPVVSVKSAMGALGRAKPNVNAAVNRLVEAGILTQITVGRRNRAFEAHEVIDAFADLERQLASPDADTHASPPVRAVPARRS